MGRERRYRLRAVALREVERWVRQYERFWAERFDRLGEYLDREGVQ